MEEIQVGTRKEKKKKLKREILRYITLFALWCGLLYGGYALADDYLTQSKDRMTREITQKIEEKISKTDTENQKKFKALEGEVESVSERLDILMSQLGVINENLSIAEETMNGTHETREALETQISILNEQLNHLQQSIQELEEAARVY